MINIDSKIINSLNESELYLFAILLNYGKESHPKNEVLKAKTGWAMNKLQATKKSLVDKGLLKVVSRYIGAEGKRVNSNEYRITTRLASKYNGKKESQKSFINDVCMIQIEVTENKVLDFEVLENQVSEIRVLGFEGDFKVLKLSIIESIKELLKREKEKENPPSLLISEIEDLKKQNELLQLEIEKLKKEKSCEKKESGKHEFPQLNGKPKAELKTPPHKLDVQQAKDKAESESLKDYEVTIKDYNFLNWTESLKEAFFEFCESTYKIKKGKFYGTQARILIKEVETGVYAHGINKVEKCLRLCSKEGWAYEMSYLINKEKRELEDSQPKTFDKKPNHKDIPLLTGDLMDLNTWNK